MNWKTDYLDSKGYYLSIHTSNWNKDKEKELLTKMPGRGIRGIILYPVSNLKNLEIIYSLYMNRYPIIIIDQFYDVIPVSSVVSDNFDGGYSAAVKLLQLGH